MPIGDIKYNRSSDVGRKIAAASQMINEGKKFLSDAVKDMAEMKDGGAVTSYLQGELGCPDLTEAQELVAECESMDFKLTTNDSQANVGTAITQWVARVG